MKLNQESLGHQCPKCRQTITQAVIYRAVTERKFNARKSVATAKERGHKLGKKSVIDWDAVVDLREHNFTHEQIGTYFGVTEACIRIGLKRRGLS